MDVNKSFLSLELWIDSDENSNRWNSIFRIISSSLVFNRPLIAWASGLAVISALCMRSLSFCWVCVSVKMGQLRSCFWHLVNYLIKPMASFASNQYWFYVIRMTFNWFCHILKLPSSRLFNFLCDFTFEWFVDYHKRFQRLRLGGY